MMSILSKNNHVSSINTTLRVEISRGNLDLNAKLKEKVIACFDCNNSSLYPS